MKRNHKLLFLAIGSISSLKAYDQSADNAQPKHQGFGRIFNSVEQAVTLHPGKAVKNLGTGDEPTTTFGWHENDKGDLQANNATTTRNGNTQAAQAKRAELKAKATANKQALQIKKSTAKQKAAAKKQALKTKLSTKKQAIQSKSASKNNSTSQS